jgi:transcriptional regulator with XRE-family HTH domain
MNLNVIGSQIRTARKKNKITQQNLGELLGMSRATISGIENGTIREIGIRKVISICDTLGIELIVREKSRRPTLQQLLQENDHA